MVARLHHGGDGCVFDDGSGDVDAFVSMEGDFVGSYGHASFSLGVVWEVAGGDIESLGFGREDEVFEASGEEYFDVSVCFCVDEFF